MLKFVKNTESLYVFLMVKIICITDLHNIMSLVMCPPINLNSSSI